MTHLPEPRETPEQLLEAAWEAAVKYRWKVHAERGIWRSHLVDLDLWGVLDELSEEKRLIGTPAEVMARILREDRQPELPVVILDPAQEIYDACIHLLTSINAIAEEPQP